MMDIANPAKFELNGGHTALDFVNTRDYRFRQEGAVELLGNYADLLRFAQQTKLLSGHHARQLGVQASSGAAKRAAATQASESARELREAVASALYTAVDRRAPAASVIHALERHFLAAGCHRQLRWRQSTKRSAAPGAHWVWGGAETALALPVWMLAQTACELMASALLGSLRACGDETCRWLFLDTSKNHTRRWCDMKICGNRMKARRFHARRKAGES